jgi:hypothetical protein
MRLNIVQQKENPKAEDKKALLRYMAILDPYQFYHDCDHDMRRKPKRPLENTTFHSPESSCLLQRRNDQISVHREQLGGARGRTRALEILFTMLERIYQAYPLKISKYGLSLER